MSNKCIFQAKIPDESNCLIPIRLKKGTLSISGWNCDYHDEEADCPIVKEYERYAEDCHVDACNDCEHDDDEDPIREAMNDAYD